MREFDKQVKSAQNECKELPSYRAAFAYLHIPESNANVLDFGCGNGGHSALWRKNGNRVSGIDVSEKALTEARLNNPDIEFKLAESGIPFPDNSFDIVISLDSIEHVENDGESLTEMWRVLKPGGRLILTTPYRNMLGDWMDGDNLIYLPLIRLKNLLLKNNTTIPRHRHYKSSDLLEICKGKFELEKEVITGGPHTVFLATLGKLVGIISAKLKLRDNKIVSSIQNKLKSWGQKTHFHRWGPLADKLNTVMRRSD